MVVKTAFYTTNDQPRRQALPDLPASGVLVLHNQAHRFRNTGRVIDVELGVGGRSLVHRDALRSSGRPAAP